MTDFMQTAALRTLIGETYLLRFEGKLAYGVVKVASARTGVVVHFGTERHVFTPLDFCTAATPHHTHRAHDFYTAATKGC